MSRSLRLRLGAGGALTTRVSGQGGSNAASRQEFALNVKGHELTVRNGRVWGAGWLSAPALAFIVPGDLVLSGLRVGYSAVSCGQEGDGFVVFVGGDRLGCVVVSAARLLVFVGSAGQVGQSP